MNNVDERLTPAEDAELRRLYWFERLGCHLSDALAGIKDGIRARDRRAYVREPDAAFDAVDAVDPVAALPPKPRATPEKRTTVEQEGGYWIRVHRD